MSGLARALATDPGVLLMDEAFSALDPLIRTEMQDELLKLQAEQARTVVFISHDLDEAMRIGDRIAIMEGGRVLQVGTAEEILKNPADDYVRSFFRGVDVANIYKARRHRPARSGDGHPARAPTGVRTALQQLRDYDREYGFVRDKDGRFRGVVSVGSLMAADQEGDSPGSTARLPRSRAGRRGRVVRRGHQARGRQRRIPCRSSTTSSATSASSRRPRCSARWRRRP